MADWRQAAIGCDTATLLSVLDRVLRCAWCGGPPMSMGIGPSRGKDNPHLIPLDKVPVGLRDYASIDPLFWSAPLRARRAKEL